MNNTFPLHADTIPFTATSWQHLPTTEHAGETGVAYWRTIDLPGLRIRVVTYSPGYRADHWCTKGHVLYVLEGTIVTELKTGEQFTLSNGMSYQVSDDMSAHRTSSKSGATLFIVDGNFLHPTPTKHKRGIWM